MLEEQLLEEGRKKTSSIATNAHALWRRDTHETNKTWHPFRYAFGGIVLLAISGLLLYINSNEDVTERHGTEEPISFSFSVVLAFASFVLFVKACQHYSREEDRAGPEGRLRPLRTKEETPVPQAPQAVRAAQKSQEPPRQAPTRTIAGRSNSY